MMDWLDIVILLAKSVFVMVFLLQILPLLIWAERKGAAYIQDRPGPNRADIFGIRLGGLVHTLTDVVKLLFKEDVTPSGVYHPFYKMAPVISMTIALCTFAVVPFGDVLVIGDRTIPLQVAGLNSGLLYVFAIGSLGIYGIMLAGWSSNNKYALLGGIRSSAQMISYEITLGLSAAVMFLFYGTAQLDVIVDRQSANPLGWGIFSVPGFIAFVLFLTASFAETNRLPFDLPEGESELVAGYHVEYSAFKFAMFFMAEYVNMIVASGIIVTLFFGGYHIPFLSTETLMTHAPFVTKVAFGGGATALLVIGIIAYRNYTPGFYGDRRDLEPLVLTGLFVGGALFSALLAVVPDYTNITLASIATVILQFSIFTAKVLFFCWFFIWIRWTLPRFRYDQLMRLGWSYMFPIGLFNLMIAGLYLVLFPNGILKPLGLM